MKINGRSNGSGSGWSFGRWGSTKTASTNTNNLVSETNYLLNYSPSSLFSFSSPLCLSLFLNLHVLSLYFITYPLASLPDPSFRFALLLLLLYIRYIPTLLRLRVTVNCNWQSLGPCNLVGRDLGLGLVLPKLVPDGWCRHQKPSLKHPPLKRKKKRKKECNHSLHESQLRVAH